MANAITDLSIVSELKQSYLDYSMSVIVGRALPDIRDGLKPVHRRILFAMDELSNSWNRPYKKSGRIVGDVLGKYHPHSDVAIYDSIVRMAQPFSMRHMLIDGQGNFGSIDGDSAAAMRYTEIRLHRLTHEMLADLDKDTVDFVPNYDNSEKMPAVLPAGFPNLLVNGSSGIAVGMATNIPTHNLSETINACLHLMKHADATTEDLMVHMPGPDFPTGGIIISNGGIKQAYETGRGKIYVTAQCEIEAHNGRESIIINELPYMVNKARLVEKMAELVKEKRIDTISGIRDESDKDGMRLVIEVKKNEDANILLNKLYALTQLRVTFGINMVALDKGRPQCFSLKHMLEAFLQHRKVVVSRRTIYDLNKTRKRLHVLEGLQVALANIDEMIQLIKSSKTTAIAREKLREKKWSVSQASVLKEIAGKSLYKIPGSTDYGFEDGGAVYRLSLIQAQAILDLKLNRLTGLEQEKLMDETKECIRLIGEYHAILSDSVRLAEVICEELTQIRDQYAEARRTVIKNESIDFNEEDFITDEAVMISLSIEGYVKRQSIDTYQAQRRGGRGKVSTALKEDDIVKEIVTARSKDMLLFFTNQGKVFWKRAYEIPLVSRTARGRPLVNYLQLDEGESVTSMLALSSFEGEQTICMATAKGYIKKTKLIDYSRPRASGIRAIDLVEGDYLIGVSLAEAGQEIMLFSSHGKAIRFNESDVRCMGRVSRGVRGIRLKDGAQVISLNVVTEGQSVVLTVTEKGYGKCSKVEHYRKTARGGQGVRAMLQTARTGPLIRALQVKKNQDIFLVTNKGTLIRIEAAKISVLGRSTQGVRLIKLGKEDTLIAVESVDHEISEE